MKIINMVEQQLVTTSNQLEGYRVSKHLGVVRGITVRSRSIFGNIAGAFQTLAGGKIVARYLKDAASKVLIYDMTGKEEKEIMTRWFSTQMKKAPMRSSICVMMQMK